MTFANEGDWDRALRILAGIVLGYAAWAIWPGAAGAWSASGITGLLLLVIGIVAFVTGLIGWCPAYTLFHFSTKTRVRA